MDFETIIKNAVAEGKDTENIAAAFTEALNKVQRSNKRKEEREAYVRQLREALQTSINDGKYTTYTAAYTAGLAAAAQYPAWDTNTIKQFITSVQEAVSEAMKFNNDITTGRDPFEVALKHFSKKFESKKFEKECGENSDDEKLQRFLMWLN